MHNEIFGAAGEVTGSCQLVFRGDLGAPIVRDPTAIEDADWVLIESTYGNRLHRPRVHTLSETEEGLRAPPATMRTCSTPHLQLVAARISCICLGAISISGALATGRSFSTVAQANQATGICARHADVYEEDAARLRRTNRRHPLLPNLHFARTPAQSMAILVAPIIGRTTGRMPSGRGRAGLRCRRQRGGIVEKAREN